MIAYASWHGAADATVLDLVGIQDHLLLLPDTDSGGALDVARCARRSKSVQVDRALTASLGVASYPTDALDSDTGEHGRLRPLRREGLRAYRVEFARPSSAAVAQAELSSSRID